MSKFLGFIYSLLPIFNLQLFADEQTLNATTRSDVPTNWKEYWDTSLLENARANLIFDQFAKKEKIKGGKVQWRKWNTFAPALVPLTEGVTPPGTKFGQSSITATALQYGDYTTITDRLEKEGYDDTIAGATVEMGAAGALTRNTLTRDVLSTGTSVAYAPKLNANGSYTAITSRADLTPDCKLTTDFVKKANTWLKKNKAPTFPDGKYVMIVNPSVSEDFRNCKGWEDANKYTNAEAIYKGEIGTYDNFRFIENTEAKVHAPALIGLGQNKFTVKTAVNSSTTSVTVVATDESSFAADTKSGLTIPVYVNGVVNTVTAYSASAADTVTLTLGTAVTSLAVGDLICGQGAGKDGSATYDSIALGFEAYGVADPEGEEFEMILHSKEDNPPLNLYSTIGYKLCHCAAILYQERMIRLESGSSYSYSDEAN